MKCIDCKYFVESIPNYDNPTVEYGCNLITSGVECEPTDEPCENFVLKV